MTTIINSIISNKPFQVVFSDNTSNEITIETKFFFVPNPGGVQNVAYSLEVLPASHYVFKLTDTNLLNRNLTQSHNSTYKDTFQLRRINHDGTPLIIINVHITAPGNDYEELVTNAELVFL